MRNAHISEMRSNARSVRFLYIRRDITFIWNYYNLGQKHVERLIVCTGFPLNLFVLHFISMTHTHTRDLHKCNYYSTNEEWTRIELSLAKTEAKK
jgi:hypothetical protein